MTKSDALFKRLESIAYKVTMPFCYHCYTVVLTGKCAKCCSDDLMSYLPGIGVEYGVDWVILHIIHEHVAVMDMDEAFEEYMAEVYPGTTEVGYLSVDTVTAMKDLDPISWGLAKREWADELVEECEVVSFDNGLTYYRVSDIVDYLDKVECN